MKKFVFFIHISLCILMVVPGLISSADTLPVLDEILVTSQRSERFLTGTAADITVLSAETISRLNAQTIPEILETIALVSLRERGTPGSQSDISIGGSSIEGVLVLVNGVRLHDPQTGHFTMDIPVDLSSVERIEVMSGGGSSLYGSSASGGVINIVTKDDADGLHGGISVGSYGSGNTNFSYAKQFSNSNILLSLRSGRSDGYRNNSQLEYYSVEMMGSFEPENWSVRWNAGLLDKSFGAGNFYGPYPSFEKTMTVQGGIHASRILSDRKMIRFRIGTRGHDDDFMLYEENPDFYRNTHYNRSSSIAVEYLSDIRSNIFLLVGAETEHLGITGGSLGSHSDYTSALYGEFAAELKKTDLSFSLRLNNSSRDETVFSPAFGFVAPIGERSRFRLRTERTFRTPTYTDRYYQSPSNIGDPLLKSEYTTSVSTGFDVKGENSNYGISLFIRETTDVIDWVLYNGETVWKVANHGRLVTNGVEMKVQFAILNRWEAGLNGVLMNQSVRKRKGVKSRYSLNPLERTIAATLSGPTVAGIDYAMIARYERPVEGGDRFPVTMSCSRSFGGVKAVFSVRNLFNERYEEFPDLPAPGRWLNLRIEYSSGS